jgi:hypothetical protein
MKTLEQINERIGDNIAEVEYLRKHQAQAMKSVEENITRHAADPDYITQWIDTWMGDVRHYESKIENLENENRILKWVAGEHEKS